MTKLEIAIKHLEAHGVYSTDSRMAEAAGVAATTIFDARNKMGLDSFNGYVPRKKKSSSPYANEPDAWRNVHLANWPRHPGMEQFHMEREL